MNNVICFIVGVLLTSTIWVSVAFYQYCSYNKDVVVYKEYVCNYSNIPYNILSIIQNDLPVLGSDNYYDVISVQQMNDEANWFEIITFSFKNKKKYIFDVINNTKMIKLSNTEINRVGNGVIIDGKILSGGFLEKTTVNYLEHITLIIPMDQESSGVIEDYKVLEVQYE